MGAQLGCSENLKRVAAVPPHFKRVPYKLPVFLRGSVDSVASNECYARLPCEVRPARTP